MLDLLDLLDQMKNATPSYLSLAGDILETNKSLALF